MRKLIEFQILDTNAEHYGIDLSSLMDNAGLGIADYISNNFDTDIRVSVVCGNGNNGGDGYVASHILIGRGFNVKIFKASNPSSDIANEKYALVREKVREIKELESFKDEIDVFLPFVLINFINRQKF